MFISDHADRDALHEDLIRADRARIVYIGVDTTPDVAHRRAAGTERLERAADAALPRAPTSATRTGVFALRLLEALGEGGWDGALVLAGPRVEPRLLGGRGGSVPGDTARARASGWCSCPR